MIIETKYSVNKVYPMCNGKQLVKIDRISLHVRDNTQLTIYHVLILDKNNKSLIDFFRFSEEDIDMMITGRVQLNFPKPSNPTHNLDPFFKQIS